MSTTTSDPRVFFAAERTLLAWVRTGITIMAFGFVVARFGLFLRMLAMPPAHSTGALDAHHLLSTGIGIALVMLGVGCLLLGAIQHRSFVATLPPVDVPRTHAAVDPLTLCFVLATLGVVLAVYLAL